MLVSFYRWISKFKKEKNDEGIFTRWMLDHDNSFSLINNKLEIETRLKKHGCSEFMLGVFEKLWLKFLKFPDAKISIPALSGQGKKYRERLD